METNDTNRAKAARGVEPLENRQLFTGFAADGPGHFPGLRAFAHYVETDPAAAIEVAIDTGHFSFAGPVQSRMFAGAVFSGSESPGLLLSGSFSVGSIAFGAVSSGAASSGLVSSSNASVESSTSAAGPVASRDALNSSRNLANATAAHASTAGPDASADGTTASAASIVALALSDSNPASPADHRAAGPVARSGVPAAPVVLSLANPKIFAERPVTATVFAQAATQSLTSGLPSYLKLPAAYEMTACQSPLPRAHAERDPAAADETVTVAGVKVEQGPQHATLAAMPAVNPLSQPLWQRVVAASATVVLLAVNWMLRRKRAKSRHFPAI